MGDSGTVRALNASAPKHAWTSADREFLGVTHRLYDIANIELTQIFNTLNDDRLQQEGFRNGLKTTAISSQVADLKRTDRGGVFQDVLSRSTFNVQNRFGELIINIEQAAATLDIALPARSGGTAATVPVTRRLPKARLDEWATESEPSMSPPAPNPVTFELNPPKRRRIVATPSPTLLKVSHLQLLSLIQIPVPRQLQMSTPTPSALGKPIPTLTVEKSTWISMIMTFQRPRLGSIRV
ncbi:hypothetical protein LTR99_009849 [Exophiala xenobiotica]|uniref:Uncharacterized protein n=1 Tax=Vermiconidia calcicola TaxID=1690605 RepID=A0AAV9Q7L9_9PEZI|nr:hypothetical protein LTR99_009849 [Exophiala xenobiotica]KAK5429922.1 hypothetical protein LTR34_006623 [Exophiala xenobiotica]KAK5536848.1 hypothetical protein LTR25_005523 [Vermiconidia calcicola]KAK5542996.1 hypothetical protein LTR23_005037 [Chaetothyriales sp. CCFEE 6169]